jgi:protein arginine kinase activator
LIRMKREMKQAIEREEYERASQLRDKIRQIEQEDTPEQIERPEPKKKPERAKKPEQEDKS